jgi:hypothetical protein
MLEAMRDAMGFYAALITAKALAKAIQIKVICWYPEIGLARYRYNFKLQGFPVVTVP